MIIRISAFIIMAISFLILFYKNDSDNYMAILLIVWLMLIYAELCDIESLLLVIIMKLTLTKQEVLLIQLLLHIYKNGLPDDVTEKHGRFVGKLYKKIKRQVINQLKQ